MGFLVGSKDQKSECFFVRASDAVGPLIGHVTGEDSDGTKLVMKTPKLRYFVLRQCLDYEPFEETANRAVDKKRRIINVVENMDKWAESNPKVSEEPNFVPLEVSVPLKITDESLSLQVKALLEILLTIHDREMIRYLLGCCTENSALPGWIALRDQALGFTDPSKLTIPEQIGYYCYERLTPFDKRAIYSALQSFHTAITAANATTEDTVTYAICRTPGHHAAFETMGGFCYINHVLGSIYALRQKVGPDAVIALLDIDRHHGNGSEAILHRLKDNPIFKNVGFISTHQDPSLGYEPIFTGFHSVATPETARQFPSINNLPYNPVGFSQEDLARLLANFDSLLSLWKPSAIVVSLGVDALDSDPVDPGGWPIEAFGAFGSLFGKHSKEAQYVTAVHEGGYDQERCGECVTRFWDSFLSEYSN